MLRNAILVGACAAALLSNQGEACQCNAKALCDNYDYAEAVVRAVVVARTAGDDEFSDVNYDIEVLEVYKSETGVEYATEINFATRGDTALCGVYLEIGEEYLLDLHRYEGALRSIGACGMTQPMLEVDEADVGSLENECADAIDNCDGECGKYQECLLYGEDLFYCADSCDNQPCGATKACTLEPVECASEPCPPESICSTASSNEEVDQESTNSAPPVTIFSFAVAVGVMIASVVMVHFEL